MYSALRSNGLSKKNDLSLLRFADKSISAETEPAFNALNFPSLGKRSIHLPASYNFSRLRLNSNCREPIQTKLSVNVPGDEFEREAEMVSDQVMRMPDSNLLQRKCAKCKEDDDQKNLRRKPVSETISPLAQAKDETVPAVKPSLSHKINSSIGSGHSMDTATRSFMSNRFGFDFSKVRIHTDEEAGYMNRELNAKAFTIGNDIFFNAGEYRPGTAQGKHLLAHELTHTIQNNSTTTIQRRPKDPTAAATYPTAEERADVMEILNPQQQEAAESGEEVSEVKDPDGFKTKMEKLMAPVIGELYGKAAAVRDTSISVEMSQVQDIGDIAEKEVKNFYGPYLTAAVHSADEEAERKSYKLREHIHEIPSTLTDEVTDKRAKDIVASYMRQEGSGLLDSFNVISGEGARDQALFQNTRDFIFNTHKLEMRTVVLFYPKGYELGGESYIQRRLAPKSDDEPIDETLKSGRWRILGTAIHEMLHAVAHEDFEEATGGLEQSGIATEGFDEYFTRPVYDKMAEKASGDDKFRESIEGSKRPYSRPAERDTYEKYYQAVVTLVEKLGGNEENLKVAYFMGKVEFIGLGGWNKEEAIKRRFTGNTLGFAAMLTGSSDTAYFRAEYGRVVLGRGGKLQLHLGGEIDYLTKGDRLGLGGSAYLQFSGDNQLYVRGGVDVTASTSLQNPSLDSSQLNVIPGLEAGVWIGRVKIGMGTHLLIPVTGGPISDKTIQLVGGVGASLDF